MRLYWTTTSELCKTNPEIFCHNLKKEGMFIGAPGTIIFRTKQEALDGIVNAKAWIAEQRFKDFEDIVGGQEE